MFLRKGAKLRFKVPLRLRAFALKFFQITLGKKSGKTCPIFIMRNKLIFVAILSLLTVGTLFGQRKPIPGKICGNPNVRCNTNEEMFSPSDIQFVVKGSSPITESEPFYAVILKSNKIEDFFGGEETCKAVDTEEERLVVQRLFPNNKVFSQRCGYDSLYYTGVADYTVFLAVYAGKTLAQAQSFLITVNAAGKFKGVYIKRIKAEFNGT